LIVGLGYDPVWFGIAVVLLIEIGMLTPPLGMNLFIILAVSQGRLSLSEIVRGCIPYWFILLGSLAILTIFPEIAVFLPRLIMQ
jgi:TRAP-type C4-dicarboxylate transport system permease large subunit